MKTPDLTLAQGIAVVKNVVAVVVAFGVPLTSTERVSLIALAGSLGVVLIAADAAIRRARAQHVAGPLADLQAATAIAGATTAVKTGRLTRTIESEAAAEAAATAANTASDTPTGIDPAAPPN